MSQGDGGACLTFRPKRRFKLKLRFTEEEFVYVVNELTNFRNIITGEQCWFVVIEKLQNFNVWMLSGAEFNAPRIATMCLRLLLLRCSVTHNIEF